MREENIRSENAVLIQRIDKRVIAYSHLVTDSEDQIIVLLTEKSADIVRCDHFGPELACFVIETPLAPSGASDHRMPAQAVHGLLQTETSSLEGQSS